MWTNNFTNKAFSVNKLLLFTVYYDIISVYRTQNGIPMLTSVLVNDSLVV